jgi:HEAT repeat protein
MISALSNLRVRNVVLACALLVSSAEYARAQPAQRASDGEAPAADLARGWTLLSQGNAAGAEQLGNQLLAEHPRSTDVLSFAVDAAVARGGPAAGLDAYEHWLGKRTVEAPYTLRSLATASLRAVARSDAAAGYRVQAIQALRADGETDLLRLAAGSGADTAANPSVAAAAGSHAAVTSLAGQLSMPGPARQSAIAALGASHVPAAEAPLAGLLDDPDPMVREAAANALGQLGSRTAIARLQGLMNDPVFSVHFAAAQALADLGDSSADTWLRSLESSEHSTIQAAAADALKNQAGADWQQLVRQLTSDSDPEVRRKAAELIAPYDPDLARHVLEALMKDPNPAERQAAGESYERYAITDFTALRHSLRSTDTLTRVRAASRILQLTR